MQSLDGCKAENGKPKVVQLNKEGISRTEDARNWKWEAKRQYFRQGWCESSSIELNQVFSDEEAKNSCDLKNLDS